jgi:hypothetical protein
MFISGRGWIDTRKWKNVKRVFITPFKEVTGKALKEVKDLYGYEAAMGMVQGWCNQSLFHDNSHGLAYAKLEFCNACDLGEYYDKYTDVIQDIGDKFIASLLENGFYMSGEWLYHGDEAKKDTNDFGNIVGHTGIYEKIKLHPLQHVDHALGSFSFMGRMLPSWNPMDFEGVLRSLFYAKYNMDDEDNYKAVSKRRETMSVLDQITDLTNAEVGASFERIFEAQDEFISRDNINAA